MYVCRFHIVKFPLEGTSEIVPQNWISGGKCFWPPVSGKARLRKLVTTFAEPAENWLSYDVVILKTTSK